VLASVLAIAAGALTLDAGGNHAPVWDPSTPKEASGSETSAIHFTVRASDPDNDPLTYKLTGLPTGAKAEAGEGAIQVTWAPTSSDLGVYDVTATASDGKTTVSRTIKMVVTEEHESFFMPGVGYALFVPGDPMTYGVFNGFSVEFLAVRWVHQNEKRGPSHGRIYVAFDVLFSTHSAVDPAFLPLLGVDMSFERDPGRRFLIPYFGLEGGAIFQKQTGTLGLMTPLLGLHVYSAKNVEVGLRAGYMLPFSSEQFGQVAGLRARLTADVAFW
jgi:hypothetical protein